MSKCRTEQEKKEHKHDKKTIKKGTTHKKKKKKDKKAQKEKRKEKTLRKEKKEKEDEETTQDKKNLTKPEEEPKGARGITKVTGQPNKGPAKRLKVHVGNNARCGKRPSMEDLYACRKTNLNPDLNHGGPTHALQHGELVSCGVLRRTRLP